MDKSFREQVDDLTNTSVQDMQSGLWSYGVDDLQVLRAARRRCAKRGEKTRAKILAAKIKKLEKQQSFKMSMKAKSIEKLTVEVKI